MANHPNNKSPLILLCFFFLVAICVIPIYLQTKKTQVSKKVDKPQTDQLVKKLEKQKNEVIRKSMTSNFHQKVTWETYREKHEKSLKKLKIRSVKAIFYTQSAEGVANYVVSLKRHDKSKSKKDGRYEFPGGKIDKKEKVLLALRREVAEEDDSGVLISQLRYLIDSKPGAIRYKIITLKDETNRAIFLIPLKENQWKELDYYYQQYNPENNETYGFDRLNNSYFNLTKEIKRNWTPQTIKAIKALLDR